MELKSYRAGELIFREGDESQDAYRVVSGKIRISIGAGNARRILSNLSAGEIFGEMGMVDDQPRSATATAAVETKIEVIPMDAFARYIQSNPERLSSYLATVFERLRATDVLLQLNLQQETTSDYIGKDDHSLEDLLYSHSGPGTSVDAGEPQTLRLRALYSVNGINADPIEMTVDKFPFRVGRLDALEETTPFGNNDLRIPDGRPFQISRNHCSIEDQSGRFIVRDRGSTLGTTVNGKLLGVKQGIVTEELVAGDNVIVLGGPESPHKFSLVIS